MQESGTETGRLAAPRRAILDTREFLELLRGERARADRLRQPLAVLVFDPAARSAGNAFWNALLARLRVTDQPGWWTGDVPAVLLRGATVRGAVRFAEELRTALLEPFECTVYGYPPFEYGLRQGWGTGSDAVDGLESLAESIRPAPRAGSATEERS